MARKALIEKEKKRQYLNKKHQSKRKELKAILKDPSKDMDEKVRAQFGLQWLPRNSAAVRGRRRCFLDGRPRGITPLGIARGNFRKLASSGVLPGIKKVSW